MRTPTSGARPLKTVTEHIRASLLKGVHSRRRAFDELRHSQWSSAFEALMRNRLIVGALRYGGIDKPYPPLRSSKMAAQRLALYAKTGNLEHLVDAANFCLIEFVTASHPKAHWKAQDRDE